jgi:hypothetical protein
MHYAYDWLFFKKKVELFSEGELLPLFLVAVVFRNLLHIGEARFGLGDGLHHTAEGLVIARLLDKTEEVILNAVLRMLVAGSDGLGDVSLLVGLLESLDGVFQVLNSRVNVSVIGMIDMHKKRHYPQVGQNCKCQVELFSNIFGCIGWQVAAKIAGTKKEHNH